MPGIALAWWVFAGGMMTRIVVAMIRGMSAAGLLWAVGGVASAQPERLLPALGQLEPGLWEMRLLDNRPSRPSICVSDPSVLIQLEHRNIVCDQLVITNTLENLTIHYVCPFNGFGQTSLRVFSPRFVRLDTQGISKNAPFAYRAELRRLGPCLVPGRQRR